MKIELADCERALMQEIGDPNMTVANVTVTYGLALRSSEAHTCVDWGKVNRAIIARWSVSALERIKKAAWGAT